MSDNLFNRDVERAVLGAVLASDEPSKTWALCSDVVTTPLAFYGRNEQIISLVLGELWQRGKPIDPVSLAEGIKQVAFTKAIDSLKGLRGKHVPLVFEPDLRYEDSALVEVGGFNAIHTLAEAHTSASALVQNCRILMEYYALRQALELLKTSAGKLDAPSGRSELRKEIESLTERLIKLMGGRSGTRTMTEAMDSVITNSLMAASIAAMVKPVWPIDWLNEHCRLRPGSMVTLSGTSGGGKTSLAFQTAVETARALKKEGCVGFVSREMAAEDLAARLMCTAGGLDFRGVEQGEYGEVALRDAQAEATKVIGCGGNSVAICDTMEKLSYKEICAWARSLHTRTAGNLRLLVVDHIGLLDGAHPKQNEYERQVEATRAFKTLAMELKIVVLVLCQLNKQGQRTNGQRMEDGYGAEDFDQIDLKGAGSIAQDADAIVFICKQGHDDQQKLPVKFKVAKNRWGPKGEVQATFEKANNQRFVVAKPITRPAKSVGEPTDDEDLFGP